MNKYHIFEIKKEIYKTYKGKEKNLFKLLYNLYNLNKPDLNYGITLYNQLCNIINKETLYKYIKVLNIKEKIIIKPSHIIYITDKIDINTIYILNTYSKTLFICEFNKKQYNWINHIE